MDSTSASRVRRLMEKPNSSIIAKVPTTESNIAITGITTDRGRTEKGEHHQRDDQQRFEQGEDDLVDRAVHEQGRVVDDRAAQALRPIAPGYPACPPSPASITFSRLAVGVTWMPT